MCEDMAFVVYAATKSSVATRLLDIIGLLLPEKKFEICRSVKALSKLLRQSVSKPAIVVLLASSRQELQEFISIQDLLEDAKIILIVPDTNSDTVAKGHKLRPRFVSDSNSNFVDVAAVLGLMIKNLEHANNIGMCR